jgi:glycosyltransferase involved in cell wall biosynthesis
MHRIRLLGVLLCYNDGDLLEDSIQYLLNQNHNLIVWDHGSTDCTAGIIRRFEDELIESRYIPRDFDFYELYPAMSRHLIETYASRYDWISWPDQDEFLEGPSRSKSYSEWIEEVHASPYDWMQFNNFNYWFTNADNPAITSPVSRIRRYSLFPDCAPRIRSWRASATNIRVFNHNPPLGEPWPARFNLRHYSMRSRRQMLARLLHDRINLRRGNSNYHYGNMQVNIDRLTITAEDLHYDDGTSELNPKPIFNWRSLYGHGPAVDSGS